MRAMPQASTPLPVRVRPVDDATAKAVRALRVAPAQWPYVGDTAANLTVAQQDPHSEAMAILAGERVVGFYRLDYREDAIAERAMPEPSVGLRGFVIDLAQQGHGYGQRAIEACCEDLRLRHPDRRLLALTVNCRNAAAIAAYLKVGFVDTGALYLGGGAGPQHLMLRRLHPSFSPTAAPP